MSSFDPRPVNPETDPNWNREPGIVPVPGSNYANEMAKWEQFPSKWTTGTVPGRPYQYRPFPKMLYQAKDYQGQIRCMAAPPDPLSFPNPAEFMRAEAQAQRFTESCQKIVPNEAEMQKAFENGWRESPVEAVEYLQNKRHGTFQATAERNHEDRNMSEPAKREIAQAEAAAEGAHVPVIEEKRRGPGRPRRVEP